MTARARRPAKRASGAEVGDVRRTLREAEEEAQRWLFGLTRDYENSWNGAFKNLAPPQKER